MRNFQEWIENIENQNIKLRVEEIHNFVLNKFPQLHVEIKWNQLMFLLNQTFILALSVFKNHISIAPEKQTMILFDKRFREEKIETTSMLFKIQHNREIPWRLIEDIVETNINDKKNSSKFWR